MHKNIIKKPIKNKTMTAVEWLEQQLFNKQGKFTKGDIDKAKDKRLDNTWIETT